MSLKSDNSWRKPVSKKRTSQSSRKHKSLLKTKSHTLAKSIKERKELVELGAKKIGGIEYVKLTTPELQQRFRPAQTVGRVMPKVWELPNRKRFFEWILSTFEQYELGTEPNNELIKQLEANHNKSRLLQLNNTQQIIRDFLQGTSPYRGMLLYYALGVGKSCSGIAVSEAIQTLDEVLFVSKAALEGNFRNEITKCGADYMTFSNFWVFSKCETDEERALAHEMKISDETIAANGGAYFIDSERNRTEGSNYYELSNTHKDKIKRQIDNMIDARFKFLHMDSSRIGSKLSPELFSNRVVIVDEAHNLVRRMSSNRDIGNLFYNCMMTAKNCKFVFLTGTPLINKVYETTRMFNILRGYMPYIECRIKTTFDVEIDYAKIKYTLQQNPFIDQIIINKTAKTIKITRNPENFITKNAGVVLSDDTGVIDKTTKSLSGVQYAPTQNIDDETFKTQIVSAIENLGYKVGVTEGRETCLPDNEDEFNQLFYNPDLNKLKKVDVFKRRIAGLTSYYEYQDPSIFPTLKPIIIRKIPMSDYQLDVYEYARHQEIMKDKKRRQNAKSEEAALGSYRLNSRFSCTFVFPEETGNPFDGSNANELLRKLEEVSTELETFGNLEKKDMKKKDAAHTDLDVGNDFNDFNDFNELVVLTDEELDGTITHNYNEDGKDGNKYGDIISPSEKSLKKAERKASQIAKELKKTDGNDLVETITSTEKELNALLKKKYLDVLDKERATFLDMHNGSLDKLSPKYKQIITDILASPGKCFIYSQFKTLIGLNTLAIALEQTGHYIPLELKKSGTNWEMVPHKDDNDPAKRKRRYVFFTGSEDMETREINRLVFNSEWDKMGTECDKLKSQLKALSQPNRDNLYGDVVQLLFGSMSSAEGLNLKGVRTVCIVEPYWQSVLTDQVIGRARRSYSHKELPVSERDVQVYIYMATINPEQVNDISYVDVKQDVCKFKGDALGKYNRVVTSDEYLYIVAMRKKEIIDKAQLIMKETAIDCILNYRDNKLTNPALTCMDYETTNRDDYLYLPNIGENIDLVEINQEKMITVPYTEVKINGETYYYNQIPGPDGKIYLYDSSIQTKVRTPAPVGIVVLRDGKRQFALFPKKNKSKSKSHSKSHSKSKK